METLYKVMKLENRPIIIPDTSKISKLDLSVQKLEKAIKYQKKLTLRHNWVSKAKNKRK